LLFSFRTTFNEFSSRHSKDERFRAVEKIRDREAWFHEYVQELKTQEKEGSNRHSEKEKVRVLFLVSQWRQISINKYGYTVSI
jgi:transcription elongation regulator 1